MENACELTVELADRTIREEFVESTSSAKDMLDDDYINSLHNNGHIALHFPKEEFSEEFIELKSTQIRRRCIEGRSINNYTVTGFLYKPDGSEEQVISSTICVINIITSLSTMVIEFCVR